MVFYLRDGPAERIKLDAALRKKLIESNTPTPSSQRILTAGQPVPSLTLAR